MSRQKIEFVVPGDGPREERGHRDDGKIFLLEELDSYRAERWCATARILIAEALKVPVPSADVGEAAALASLPLDLANLRLQQALADPELDPLWEATISYQHDPRHPPQKIRQGENCQIEEIATRQLLKMEVLKLHLGFSGGASAP